MVKTYDVVFDKKKSKGIYGISLVHDPAIKSMFIALGENGKETNLGGFKMELATVDEKEFTLIGVALIPEQVIPRSQDGKDFNIKFTKETVRDLAHNFIQKGYQGNSSIGHGDPITGVSVVEMWLVKDPKNDTANAYGLPKEDIVEGAMIVKMKCDNKEIYQDALDGKIQGFSIDALVNLKEVNLKSEINMSNQILEAIKELGVSLNLGKEKPKEKEIEVALGSIKTADGEVTIEYEGEDLAEGIAIWIAAEDDAKIAIPVGEHALEDGRILVVTEEGKVGSVKEVEEEKPQEPAPVEAEAETKTETSKSEAEAIVNSIKSVLVKYSEDFDAKLKKVDDKLIELSKENGDLKVLLSETPADKKITLAAGNKNIAKQTAYSKFRDHNKKFK